MKKIFSFLFLFFVLFSFCACKNQAQANRPDESYAITSKICELENYQELSSETIKALSVIYRTNIKNGEEYKFNSSLFDENIFNLVCETKNEVIEDIDACIYIDNNKAWSKEISKSKILETLATEGENISSFENISLKKDENGRTTNLIISNKTLNVNNLKDNFLLPSNKISKIENTKNHIIFYGEGDGFGEKFDILRSEELSKNNNGYEAIIKYFFNSYKTIK